MTSWTTPRDVADQVRSLARRGELARRVVRDDTSVLQIRLKKPSAKDISQHLMEVRDWAEELAAVPGLVIEWTEHNNRLVGRQRLPNKAYFQDNWAAAKLAECAQDLRRVQCIAAATSARTPHLLTWLERKPLKALAVADDWRLILDVHEWIRANPNSGVYARQLDIPGVHTKFVEKYKSLLCELHHETSICSVPDEDKVRSLSVLGLREKPGRLRFRLLDDFAASDLPASADIELDLASLATLPLRPPRIIVVENEITYLSLPPMTNTIAVFGSGYGVAGWADLPWWPTAHTLYWGDLDTHGFAILSQVRSAIPGLESVLMNEATLRRFREVKTVDARAVDRELPSLTVEEQSAYDLLRSGALGDLIRIEQERIPLSYAVPEILAAFRSTESA